MAASGCWNKYARPGLAELGRPLDTAPASSQAQMREAGCSRSPEPRQPRSASRLSGDWECEAGRGEARESSILFPTASVGWNRPAGQQ